MNAPSPSMRDLARRLLEASRSASSASTAPRVHEAVAVCERLRTTMSRFAGPDGFAALLRRALVLARVEVPALQTIRLGGNCQMEGLEDIADGAEAAVALAAHLLELLTTFIGEALTLRLVREGWPEIELTPYNESEE